MINQLLCSSRLQFRDDFYDSQIAWNEVIKHLVNENLVFEEKNALKIVFYKIVQFSSKQFIASVISHIFFFAH